MMECSRHIDREDKTVIGIHSRMLLETVMGFIIFYCPVRFMIAGKLPGIAMLVKLVSRTILFLLKLLNLVFWGCGGLADLTSLASTATPLFTKNPC